MPHNVLRTEDRTAISVTTGQILGLCGICRGSRGCGNLSVVYKIGHGWNLYGVYDGETVGPYLPPVVNFCTYA